MSQGYENLRGANCALPNPEIEITFKQSNLAYISKIEIQRENAQYPGNVRQFEVSMMDANNAVILDAITDKPAVWQSSENEPILRGDFRNIRGLKLKILKTDNNENVRGLRIKITGCYAGGINRTVLLKRKTIHYFSSLLANFVTYIIPKQPTRSPTAAGKLYLIDAMNHI